MMATGPPPFHADGQRGEGDLLLLLDLGGMLGGLLVELGQEAVDDAGNGVVRLAPTVSNSVGNALKDNDLYELPSCP